MNMQRLAVAAIVTWVADIAYGFVVYGWLMSGAFDPGIFRPEAEMNLALGFAASLVGFFVLAYIYAKGYEGGSGVQEGLRFGALIGILFICMVHVWNYVTLPVSTGFLFASSLTGFIELTLMGTILGALYKPAHVPVARRAVSV